MPGWIVYYESLDYAEILEAVFYVCTDAPREVVYYESIKREIKIKPISIYECRCDERLQTKTKRFFWPLIHLKIVVYYDTPEAGKRLLFLMKIRFIMNR